MSPFLAELLGTMIMIILGNGVVANVVLAKTKGNNSGWMVITFGWAIAVFCGVYIASHGSGAHLNPVVTIALASFNNFNYIDLETVDNFLFRWSIQYGFPFHNDAIVNK